MKFMEFVWGVLTLLLSLALAYVVLVFIFALITQLWHVLLGLSFLYGIIEYPNYTGTAIVSLIGLIIVLWIWIASIDSGYTGTGGYSSGGSYSESSSGSTEDSSGQEKRLPHQRAAKSITKEDSVTGKEFTVYLNERGNKIGETRKEESIARGEHEKHVNEKGEEVGWSKPKTDITGNDYKQHYRRDNSKAGTSRTRTDAANNEVTEERDEHGNKIGESRDSPGFLGINDLLGRDVTKHKHEDEDD